MPGLTIAGHGHVAFLTWVEARAALSNLATCGVDAELDLVHACAWCKPVTYRYGEAYLPPDADLEVSLEDPRLEVSHGICERCREALR